MPGSAINPFLSEIGVGLHGVYDIRNYGAVCDGATDDSGAIQDAIDAAWAAGGGIVVITGQSTGVSSGGSASADAVVIDSSLELRSGVWLRGLGSTTELRGSADPMIVIAADTAQDRMTISDLLLVQPAGVGIKLAAGGAYQLGWPRVTVQDVTVTDAADHSFWVTTGCLEARHVNCVSLRSGGHGFYVNETDNILIGCTAAQGSSAIRDGFYVTHGNTKITGCKAYGNAGNGFSLQGSGRHSVSGCEAQDNGFHGCFIGGSSSGNTVSGLLTDSDKIAGVRIDSNNNFVSGSFLYGGGGSGQVTRAGVLFDIEFGVDPVGNIVMATTNCPCPAGGKLDGNAVHMRTTPSSRKAIDYTGTWTPNPYDAEIQAMTLTGGLTLVNPVYKHLGLRLTLELTQDGSGGHTVTFPDQFRVAWTPDTAANRLNVITFEYDGSAWQQVSATTGLTPKPSVGRADTFDRADEVLNVSSSGHTWTKYNSGAGAWQVVSNAAKAVGSGGFQTNVAVLDAGVPDFRAEVTIVTVSAGPGIAWRYSDSSNFYFYVGNSIRKIVGGGSVTISPATDLGAGDVVAVLTSGPNHSIYLNGVLSSVFTDDFNLSATRAGIVASDANDVLDDFRID